MKKRAHKLFERREAASFCASRRTGFNVSQSFCCRSAVRKRPLLLPFPAERKREGPRGLSAVQFLLPLTGCSPDGVRESKSDYFHCDAGFANATSFSLLDAKRTKQEKHAWGNVPHDPRARHFGSGQLRGTLKPVRRKGFKLTASRRFRQEAFSFPRCARKFPHEPRKRRALRCLGLPSASTLTKARREKCNVVLLTGYTTGSCEKNMVPHKSLVLPTACGSRSFRKAEAAPAESDCVAREGIFDRRAKTNLPMCLRRCESSSLGRFAELFLTCLNLAAAEVPCAGAVGDRSEFIHQCIAFAVRHLPGTDNTGPFASNWHIK